MPSTHRVRLTAGRQPFFVIPPKKVSLRPQFSRARLGRRVAPGQNFEGAAEVAVVRSGRSWRAEQRFEYQEPFLLLDIALLFGKGEEGRRHRLTHPGVGTAFEVRDEQPRGVSQAPERRQRRDGHQSEGRETPGALDCGQPFEQLGPETNGQADNDKRAAQKGDEGPLRHSGGAGGPFPANRWRGRLDAHAL